MRLIFTKDFSSELENCCDGNYNKFNGSIFVSDKYTYIVWRAQTRPTNIDCRGVGQTVSAPTYPYITMSESWTYDEYCGILIIDNNDRTKSKFIKYKHMNAYPAEDPRLYTKNGKDLYLYYTAVARCNLNNNDCRGLWEVKINTYTNVFGIPKQICKDIIKNTTTKSIYDYLNWPIYKNFSYIAKKEVYLDGFNKNLETYKPLINVKTCKTDKISSNLTNNLASFVQNNWKIALTTPTILHEEKLIGVAHIRISWANLTQNFNQLSANIRGMLTKNDIHLSDTYFMSVYVIDCTGNCPIDRATWNMTKPFMITGNTLSNRYFSYDINFPCGVRMNENNGNIKISYGVGDCVFLESEISVNPTDFVNNVQFNYSDLEIFQLNLPIFEKAPIYRALNCNSTIKYLLPKIAFLFDLGGSGLKLCTYTFNQSLGTFTRLGYWTQQSLPDLNQMLTTTLRNTNKTFNGFMYEGAYALFSLAGTEKLWNPSIRSSSTVRPFLDRRYHNVYELFQIPRHLSAEQCTDNESHYYGNIKALNDITQRDVFNNLTVLSIPVGTGINMRLTVRGTVVNPRKYLWDYSYRGRGIRSSFLRASNINALADIIRYIIRESYGDFNPTSIDYIIFSGGGTNKILTSAMTEDTNNDPNVKFLPTVDILPNTTIALNTDDLCPFKGLLQKFAYDKNIL
tara:strand:+ start:226 stop:2268 length:2043 start_codon:yes stop_codon:yes gene_type:complete